MLKWDQWEDHEQKTFWKNSYGNIQLLLYQFFVQKQHESNLDNEYEIGKKAWSEYNEYRTQSEEADVSFSIEKENNFDEEKNVKIHQSVS